MKEQRIILDRRLSQLEVEKASIDHAISEIHRRFALLDEVEAWEPVTMVEKDSEELSKEEPKEFWLEKVDVDWGSPLVEEEQEFASSVGFFDRSPIAMRRPVVA